MDRIPLKLRLKPELIQKLKEIHPSYGELSRVAGELLESYVKVAENNKAERDKVYERAILSR